MTRKEKHEAIQSVIDDAYKAGDLPFPASIITIALLKAKALQILASTQAEKSEKEL